MSESCRVRRQRARQRHAQLVRQEVVSTVAAAPAVVRCAGAARRCMLAAATAIECCSRMSPPWHPIERVWTPARVVAAAGKLADAAMKSSLTATRAALLRRRRRPNLLQWTRARRMPTRQVVRLGCGRGEPCQWSALQRRNTERPQTASRLRPPPPRPPREHHERHGRSRRQHARPPLRRHPRPAIPSLNSPRAPCMIITMR